MKILAIIPARGGSKSIPHKNVVNVGGKPLIAWSITTALKCKYITKTVVTSDDSKILEVAKKYGASVIVRPKKYAHDSSLMTPVIIDCLRQLRKNNEEYDLLVLLQPTSPLRNSNDLNKSFRLFFYKKATALISGYEPEKSPFKSFTVKSNGFLQGLVDNKTPFMNRQFLPTTFYPNGAIYIIYVSDFLNLNSFFTSKTIPFYMPVKKSLDIDTLNDLERIGKILRKRHVSQNK